MGDIKMAAREAREERERSAWPCRVEIVHQTVYIYIYAARAVGDVKQDARLVYGNFPARFLSAPPRPRPVSPRFSPFKAGP